MHLAPTYVALVACLCLHNVFAVPVCNGEVTDTEPELYTGYGGGSIANYCKRSAAPDPVPAPAPEPEPAPLMISDPFGLNPDGGADGGGGGWGGRPGDIIPTNPGNAYQACYTIYSSARAKRGLGISESEIQKRCRMAKSKAKRTAEPDPNPDPLMISDPFGLGNGDGGVGGAGDGGGGPQWPGDVGDGFLQCYSVYISDKKRGLEVGGGLEKRCRKEKREAEDKVLGRDKEKYTDYEKYGVA